MPKERTRNLRYAHLLLIGVAIPVLLTATVFSVPSRSGLSTQQANDNIANRDSSKTGSFVNAAAVEGATHHITITAERLPNSQLAYRMENYEIETSGGTTDITDRYSSSPSIPGPTIILNVGDDVFLTIHNDITGVDGDNDRLVSVHVHGVHYLITSDGTLEHINMIGDQGALPGDDFTYHWIAGPGTEGTWPYHDHTWGGLNGAENKGLFGAVIVNPASGQVKVPIGNSIQDVPISNIKKDFVLYMGDDAFFGTEINAATGEQTPLWVNPTLKAKTNDYVRFHIIALGTDLHTFKVTEYKWNDPGTSDRINSVDIGPLENHQFTVKTKTGTAHYSDLNTSNNLMGMEGVFIGSASGGASVPGPSPL